MASKPAVVQEDFRNLYQEGRRNEVLNLMEIGLKAYRAGHLEEAKNALDRARVSIESIYADDDAARKARSVWYEEAEKDFKGEPYERSMVYLYLGLIFLEEGDYGNARASFIGGLLQDAFAEEEQNSADFAALIYLAGWAAMQMESNKLAEEHFEELKAFRPDAPVPSEEHNALLIVETGNSPASWGTVSATISLSIAAERTSPMLAPNGRPTMAGRRCTPWRTSISRPPPGAAAPLIVLSKARSSTRRPPVTSAPTSAP